MASGLKERSNKRLREKDEPRLSNKPHAKHALDVIATQMWIPAYK